MEEQRLGEALLRGEEEVRSLDEDVELALAGGKDELARFAIRRLLPRRTQAKVLRDELQQRRAEAETLTARLAAQEEQFETLRTRVRAALAHETAGDVDLRVAERARRRRRGRRDRAHAPPAGTKGAVMMPWNTFARSAVFAAVAAALVAPVGDPRGAGARLVAGACHLSHSRDGGVRWRACQPARPRAAPGRDRRGCRQRGGARGGEHRGARHRVGRSALGCAQRRPVPRQSGARADDRGDPDQRRPALRPLPRRVHVGVDRAGPVGLPPGAERLLPHRRRARPAASRRHRRRRSRKRIAARWRCSTGQAWSAARWQLR